MVLAVGVDLDPPVIRLLPAALPGAARPVPVTPPLALPTTRALAFALAWMGPSLQPPWPMIRRIRRLAVDREGLERLEDGAVARAAAQVAVEVTLDLHLQWTPGKLSLSADPSPQCSKPEKATFRVPSPPGR